MSQIHSAIDRPAEKFYQCS